VTLTLTLREAPLAPVDARALCPDRLAGLSRAEIGRLELRHGNRPATVEEFFEVSGDGEEEVRVQGHARLANLGAGMTGGRLVVTASAGDGAAVRSGGRPDPSTSAGALCGARMRGGELVVEGDAGDFAGAGMTGGRLVVHGSAGRRLGGELPGARMRGGEIVVHGDAGAEAGAGLRRGLIAVGGRAGAGAGVRALAGTIVALGGLGAHPGLAMRRASIVAPPPVAPPPTYALACSYRPPFLSICLRRLRALGLPVGDEWLAGRYARWSGDRLDLGRAEILVLEP
jgi:formylmethanofuran dehydrogenase subunit C